MSEDGNRQNRGPFVLTHSGSDYRLTNIRLTAFALPSFVLALLYGPILSVLPTIYAKYYSLDLAFIGTVLMVSRIFDGICDPVIGYFSDKTRSPIGQRKPWLIAGFALTMIAVYRLFIPPSDVKPMYFLGWFILLYLFLTMAEIPYQAWQAEITRNYRTRSKVVAFRAAFSCAGGLVFSAAPLLPIFETHEMTPAVLKVVAQIIAVLLPIAVLLAVVFAPLGKQVAVRASGTVFSLLKDFSRNKPFLIFVVAFLFTGLAAGMQQVLAFLYFDTFLGLGHKFPEILITMSATQLLAMPVWVKLMNKFGKHRVFAIGNALTVFVSLGFLFLKPGPSVYPAFMLMWICLMFLFASIQVTPPAIMGDVIDYDVLKSGSNRAGQYFAVFTMAVKFNLGVGGGLAFFLVDGFGYDATASIHSRSSMIGVWIALAILPSILYLIASAIM